MSSPPTPSPTPAPTPVPTSSPTPAPTPGPAPYPPDLSVALPNVPPHAYALLCGLADALDVANQRLSACSTKLGNTIGTTGGAVNNVLTISSGRTTDALSTTWHSTQVDLNSAHEPLTTITAGGYLGGATNPLRAALDEHRTVLLEGLAAVESINAMRSVCLVHPPTPAQVENLIQQVQALTAALGNIGLVLDGMALAIRSLNRGSGAVCATGFTPGGSLPLFSRHAFSSEARSTGGSESGGDGFTRLAQYLQGAGLSQRQIATILQALRAGGMSEAEAAQFFQELQDVGLSQAQIVKFLKNPTYAAQAPEIWRLYQRVAGVPNMDRVLSDLANGSPTSFAGSLYQLRFIERWAAEHPDGPFINDVEPPIGSQKGPDIVLGDGSVIDLKSYNWGQPFPTLETTYEDLARQIGRYKDAYPGARIVYYFDSAKSTAIPEQILTLLQREGVTVQYWP